MTRPFHTIYLGLGTNLGDRAQNLRQALAGLKQWMTVTAVSPIYETEPWGVTDQPLFWNMCVAGETAVSPHTLLTHLKQLEQEIGRTPTRRWGPRLIDIDILFYDDLVLQSDNLTIPHPGIPQRAFVLVPLVDIAPDWVHPQSQKTVREMMAEVGQTAVHRLPIDPLN
jgi:2-amino-4-hydroxy-6-hydroxymethyldihydropteridine diphosphokinase